MSDQMTGPIHVNGPFLRLTKSVWVRASAIVIIRGRSTANPEGSGSEVVVRTNSLASGEGARSYVVWTEFGAEQIIAAAIDCQDSER